MMEEDNKTLTPQLYSDGVPVSLKFEEPVENSIMFCMSNGNWIMKITDGKISFNRESWPDAPPDDFAKAVIAILEGATVDMENLRKQIPF